MDAHDGSAQQSLSTSAETIRNLTNLNIPSTSHTPEPHHARARTRSPSRSADISRDASPFSHFSYPSSPHSSWPSPSSPSGESVSSLPSVGSSFLFSSVPHSPPHSHESDLRYGRRASSVGHHHFGEGDNSLIIPSLTLPSALRPPTAYGQTLGRVRLLVLGSASAESAKIAEEVISLLSDTEYDDIVHVGQWEDITVTGHGTDNNGVRAKMLKVSTDWVEHPKEHGQERYEPSKNVELVRMEDYAPENSAATLEAALTMIRSPFHALSHITSSTPSSSLLFSESGPSASTSSPVTLPLIDTLFHTTHSPSLNSDSSPDSLYTAVIFVPAIPHTSSDQHLINELGKHIPLIVLPSPSGPSLHAPIRDIERQQSDDAPVTDHEEDTPKPPSGLPTDYDTTSYPLASPCGRSSLSSIRPADAGALRRSLYRSPHAVATLRREAVELLIGSSALDAASVTQLIAAPINNLPTAEKDSNGETRSSLPEKRTRRLIDRARWESDLSASEMERELNRPLDATLRARDSPLAARRGERGGSAGKAVARSSGRGVTRGRTRGMERRKTITAATQPRPTLAPLSDLQPPSPTSGSPFQPAVASPTVLSPGQTRRKQQSSSGSVPKAGYAHPTAYSTFDPLHIPSLVRLALEGLLLGPLRVRLMRLISGRTEEGEPTRAVYQNAETDSASREEQRGDKHTSLMPVALLAGAFCAGVGVGVLVARSRASV